MNENKPKFEPTLPENVKQYTDITPENEDKLYPTKTAQADNLKFYKQEIESAKTTESVKKIEKQLNKKPSISQQIRSLFKSKAIIPNKTEADLRTGGSKDVEEVVGDKLEDLQDANLKKYISQVENINDIYELRNRKNLLSSMVDEKKLRADQLPTIEEEIDAQIEELQDANLEEYISQVENIGDIYELRNRKNLLSSIVDEKRLRADQLPTIEEEIDAQIEESYYENLRKYIGQVKSINIVEDLMDRKQNLPGMVDKNILRADQLPTIEEEIDAQIKKLQNGESTN